jgi:hypothetical protein
VGETNMRLLGSMLTTRIFLAAMSRANLSAPELAKHPSFYFYVDEFQNFANETFAEILSEARKYKLNLVIAHQYIEQMEEEVRDAVFGNVGTTVVFRVGPFDAEVLEPIFAPRFLKEDIVTLDRRQVYMTLMIDGVGSAPFSAVTIPPIEAPPASHREEVIAASRKEFTAPRGGVEQVIIDELAPPVAADARPRKNPASETPPTGERRPFPPESSRAYAEPRVSRPPVVPISPTSTVVPRRVEPRAPVGKNAEDLKSILRTMTAKQGAEKEQKKPDERGSLKGALAEVLAKNPPLQKQGDTVPKLPVPEGKRPFEVPEDELQKILKGD